MFDHFVLRRSLDDAEQLLLGNERTLLQTLALHDDVGERNQTSRHHLQWPEVCKGPNGSGRQQCSLLRIDDGVRLGHRLGEDVEDDNVHCDTNDDARGPEQTSRNDAGQGRLNRLAHVHCEEDRIDPSRGVFDQARQGATGLEALVGHGRRLGLRHL